VCIGLYTYSIRAGSGRYWLKSARLSSQLKLAFYDFLQVPGAVGRCGTKNSIHLMFVNKCRLLVFLASLSQKCILAYSFRQETAFLKFNFNGMPVADGSFGWRWLVNFFGGLTDVSRLSAESAGVGEKRLRLTGLRRVQRRPPSLLCISSGPSLNRACIMSGYRYNITAMRLTVNHPLSVQMDAADTDSNEC